MNKNQKTAIVIVCLLLVVCIGSFYMAVERRDDAKFRRTMDDAFEELPYASFRICKIETSECFEVVKNPLLKK